MGAISLCSTMPKYERYRETWELLREATVGDEVEQPVDELEQGPMGPGVVRMRAAMNFFRNYLEKGGR